MGKIYGKTKVTNPKPKKKKNEHNRLRDVIVNFRVSPKEKDVLDARIAATGMSKQDYYRQSCLYQKILVKGNIRTFAAIRREVLDIDEVEVSANVEKFTESEAIVPITLPGNIKLHLYPYKDNPGYRREP